jgi:hypothetical protein
MQVYFVAQHDRMQNSVTRYVLSPQVNGSFTNFLENMSPTCYNVNRVTCKKNVKKSDMLSLFCFGKMFFWLENYSS